MQAVTVISVVLLLFSGNLLAASCNSANLPDSVITLIQQKKYAEAEKWARHQLSKSPDDPLAHQQLANVYINSALQPVPSLNLEALGYQPGESGVKEIDTDMLKAAIKDGFYVDADFRRKAKRHIPQMVKRWPQKRNSYYCLTKIEFYAGDHQSFLHHLDKTARLFKSSEKEAVDFLIGYGVKYMEQNNQERAIDVYNTLLKTFPTSAAALSSLGVTYLNRGYVSKGMVLFEKAHRSDSSDIIVIGNVAETAMLLGQFGKSEEFLKMKAKINNTETAVYFDLAMNAMHKGPDASLTYWKRYFSQNKKYPDDEAWVSNATAIHKTVVAGVSDNILYDLATQMITSKVPKYAVPSLFYLRQKSPDIPGYSYRLAHAYDVGGYFELAEQALLEALSKMSKLEDKGGFDEDQVLYNLARYNYALDNNPGALKYLDRMDKQDKQYIGAQYIYALVFRDMGKIKKAKSYLKSCIKNKDDQDMKKRCQDLLSTI